MVIQKHEIAGPVISFLERGMKLQGNIGAPELLTLTGSLVRDGNGVSISGRTLGCPVVATAVYASVLIPALYIAALAVVPIPAALLCWGLCSSCWISWPWCVFADREFV